MIESLEDRRLLNVDWRNPVDSIDVDSDGSISPLDALVVINYINAGGSGLLPAVHDLSKPYLDVDGDQSVSPLDVLSVINHLNTKGSGARSLKEVAGQLINETNVTITLGQTSGTRDYRVRIDNQFDTTDQSAALEDLLAVYLVDPLNPTNTLLDRGTNGTALFTLAGTKAEFIPGRVSWDGSVLDINLSDLALNDTGLLKFQLLNSDSDGQTKVTIVPLTNQIDVDGTNGPKLSLDGSPVAAGASTTLANLTPMTNGQLQVGNVRYDSSTGKYNAELRLRNDGEPIGREVAVVFPGLPAGVSLRSPSGTTTAGEPYINLKTAIQRGGLSHGSWSEPVAIEFNNPGQVLFVLKPKILAATNHSPTLAAIAPLTVMPGGVLNVSLVAADQDGDPITFSLVTTGGTVSLPTGKLGSSGVLTFRPTPSQLGAYQFNVIASDGALEATRSVTLNVAADPITTTRVSGKVLKVDGQPLASMPVQIGAVQGLTLADGSFTLDLGSGPIVSDTLKVRGEIFPGPLAFPFIGEKLPFVLDHNVFPGVNNVIDRPIYLPSLDLANAKTIDPAHDTTVTTPAIPGASEFVAAGTLMNQQGTPFAGKLSITEVPSSLTPAALPNGLRPDLLVTTQPGEMVFSTPAPLTLPNRGGYPPRTVMTLWAINPVSGTFDIAGTGVVSADGTVIKTVSGGIRTSSWEFFSIAILTPDISDDRNEDTACNSCKYSGGLTSQVEMGTGAVIEQHPLVAYQSNGAAHSLTLIYDSERADPRPIIHFGEASVADSPLGCVGAGPQLGITCTGGNSIPTGDDKERFVASLSVQNGSFVYQVPGFTGNLPGLSGGEHFWTYSQADRVDAALQADLRSFPSGIHQYTINAGFLRGDATGFAGSLSVTQSQVISVNTIDSPFGAGWGIAGLQNIVVSNLGDVLLIDGDGSQLRFFNRVGDYQSPPGDFTKLERVNGLFRRTTPDQTVYQFNADNQLVTITDRSGNVTTYKYTGGRLVEMTDSVGQTTTLAYTGARVSTITDPTGRITTLVYDAQGNLTSITDPDGAHRTYGYDADHHKVSETDPLGRQDQTSYGFHGRAIGGVRYDGSRIQVRPLQTQDLYSPERTSDPLNAPATMVRNTNVSYTDSNGNVTFTQLDKFGQTVIQTDRLGILPIVSRDSNNLPTSMIDARSNGTLRTYDARGNLLSQRDSLSGGSEVVGAILPAGELDHYSFVGHAGQRLFFDVPVTTNANFQINVRDSSSSYYGQHVYGQYDFTIITNRSNFFTNTTVLPRDDTYYVTVGITPDNSYPATTGAYRFRLIDLDSVTPLRFGSPISGSGVDSQIFTFHATAGQTLTLTDLSGGANRHVDWGLLDEQTGRVGDIGFFFWGNISFFVPRTGTYTLVMGLSNDGSSQKYKFQAALVDPLAVPTIGLDTDYTGTLAQNDAPLTFPFTAPAGTTIYVNKFGNSLGFAISIKDSTTAQTVGVNGQFFVVPRSGNYTANVVYTANGSGQFAFRLIDLSAAPKEPIGTIVSGTLNEAGRLMAYRFQGQAGQQIDFGHQVYYNDLGNPVSYIEKLLLLQNAYVTNSSYGQVVTLARTGEYTVLVSRQNVDSNGRTPTSFTLPLIDVSTATHVSLDAPITGQLVAGSGPRYLQFTAQKGDTLYLDDLGSSTKVRIRLHEVNFNGNPLLNFGYAYGTLVRDAGKTVDIPVTGTYLFVLDADDADRPANYNFRLLTAKTNLIPLTLGQVVQASFTEPMQTNVYTFQGTAGQQLYLDWLVPYSNDVARTLLRDPNGNSLQSYRYLETIQDFYSQRLIVLRQTGTYRLEVCNTTSRQLGMTSFRLSDVSAATSLTFGTPQAGSLVPYETALYKLHATAGQRITITQTSGDGDLVPALYLPDGEGSFVLNGSNVTVPVTVPVTFSGDYTFAVKKGVNNATPGSFEFQIGNVSDSPVTPAGIDHIYTGTGDSTMQTLGAFTANAGTLIFFDSRIGAGSVAIVDPAGVVVPFNAANIGLSADLSSDDFITLPVSGTYTVKVTAIAAFSFRVRPAEDAPLIALDTNVVGSTDTANASELYRLNVASGQILQFDRTDGNQQTIRYKAYPSNPRGTSSYLLTYDDLTVAGAFPKPLPLPGTYFVVVSRPTPGAYAFQFHDFGAAPLIALGDTITGTATPPSQATIRRFVGTAGQEIYYASTGGAWTFFRPDGVQLYGTSAGVAFTLPMTGIYSIERDDDSANADADFTLTITALDEPVRTITPLYAPSAATFYTYDPTFNQLTSVTNELNQTKLFDINPINGNVRSVTQVVGAVGGTDDIAMFFTYLPSGLIDTMTDPLGRITDYDYDALGRLLTLTVAKGTSLQTLQHFEYDAVGNRTAQIDENGHRSEFHYDAMNRLIQLIEPDAGVGPPTIRYQYDAVGNLLKVTDTLGHVSTTAYDALDRVKSKTDAGNNTTRYAYDQAGNLIQVTDPLGQVSHMRYDARNQLVASVDPSGAESDFGYDRDGNLVLLTDADGNSTRFTYDSRNRRVSELDPLGHSTATVYNAVNEVVASIDRLGRTTKLEYDELGRLIKEHWLDAQNIEVNTVNYTYDAASHLIREIDKSGDLQFSYDALNRPSQVQTTGANGVPSTSIGYSYDAVGNVLATSNTINGIADATNTYSYDALDRQTRIVQTGVGLASKRVDMAYNILGQLTSLARFADSTGAAAVGASNYAYDALNRLTSITHRNAASNVLDSFNYQYDTASRITRVTDSDGATDYSYDNRDQLTGANHADATNPDETYAYDATGNRTSSSLHGQAYKTGVGNRLKTDGTFNYTYDDAGSLVRRVTIASGAVREFAYDHRNRLVQVTDRPSAVGAATQVVKYTYDLLNRRIATNVDKTPGDAIDGVINYFVYDGQDVIADLTDPDGSGPAPAANSMRYLHGPGVDQVFAQEDAAGNVLWDLTDHLGSVHDLVNIQGQIVDHLKYDSYGNVVSQSNPAASTRYRYTGREFDTEIGMQYNQARYYDASIGRFISEDLLGFEGGDANFYRYVANSTLDTVDPEGLKGNAVGWVYSLFSDWIDKAKKIGQHAGDLSTLPEDLKNRQRARENRDDTPDVSNDNASNPSRDNIHNGIRITQKVTCLGETILKTTTDNSVIGTGKSAFDIAKAVVKKISDALNHDKNERDRKYKIEQLQKKNEQLRLNAEYDKNSPLTQWFNEHRAR